MSIHISSTCDSDHVGLKSSSATEGVDLTQPENCLESQEGLKQESNNHAVDDRYSFSSASSYSISDIGSPNSSELSTPPTQVETPESLKKKRQYSEGKSGLLFGTAQIHPSSKSRVSTTPVLDDGSDELGES